MLPLYIALYVVGMLVGLAAKIALRRPAAPAWLRASSSGWSCCVLLLWGAISVTHTPFTDVLLPLVWAGTGLLAGLGSREMHTAS